MSIQELHYAFKLSLDRIDTLQSEDFNPAQIDWLLNEAQMVFLKQRMTPHPPKNLGFENSQKRIDDLSTLVIKHPLQPALTPLNPSLGAYEIPLSTLVAPYYALISGKVTRYNSCSTSIPIRHVQHDDYTDALRDPFQAASQDQIPYNFGLSQDQQSSSIYLYSVLPIQEVVLEYVKTPNKPYLGTYQYIDGTTPTQSTLELPLHTHQEIVDIAVQLAALSTENPQYVQLKTQKLIVHE